MNWLDKAVAAVSPQAGLSRIRARAQMQVLQKLSYDGARAGRKSDGWIRPSSSQNAEASLAIRQLRDGARDLERNNPLAAKGCTEYQIKVVGTGITPQARTDDQETNKLLDDVFAQWADQANADGQPGYYGMQGLGFRTIFRDGEVLLRHRRRYPSDGPFVTVRGQQVSIPYQVQLLESDFLDHLRTYPLDTGGYVMQGVQFDQVGRRVGYWLFSNHPGDQSTLNMRQANYQSAFYPISGVEHGRKVLRAGQVRGITALAPVLVALHELDNYEQAEQTRKLIEACLTAFVYEPDDSNETLGSIVEDAQGNKVESFEPGMIAYVKGGKNVTMSEPKASGGYEGYMRTRHRVIATGINMPYEVLTNDYSQSNYSSSRMGLVSFKNICADLQWNVCVPFIGIPVWERFVDTCVVAGIVSENTPNLYAVDWAPPPFDLLDREAEALADIFELRIGKKTWPQMVGEQGEDPQKQAEAIEKWNKIWDDMGIILDCDPRKAARTGVAQKSQEGNKTPPGSLNFEPVFDLETLEVRRAEPQHVTVHQPDITVNVPQSAQPNINVSSPPVNVTTPPVNVHMEPTHLSINMPERGKYVIDRDGNGRVKGMREVIEEESKEKVEA